ncbi:MAG: FAD-dependent oxidoreductase [Rectinemataceae bacterium]
MTKRLLIVGGVAAGATAAARARRLDGDIDITIVEKGDYVSFANCGLPYRISGDIAKRSSLLLQTPEGFLSRYNVKVLLKTEALAVNRGAKKLSVRGPEGEYELPYDTLILAQGGTPFIPPVTGVDSPNVFSLMTLPDMDALQSRIVDSGAKSAAVIGGGFIGLEAAEAFIARGLATSIIELTDQLMPPADPEFGFQIRTAFAEAGAAVHTGRSVVRIDGKARNLTLDDGTVVPADIVLMSAGVRPNIDLARAAGLEIGKSGGLKVDEFLRTSDADIFAAGDMIEVRRKVDGAQARIPLAGPANRQGRIAATNALGGSMRYRGALGTSVFKAMSHTFAMTGLSEKAAVAAGMQVRSTVVHRGDHASYYPGATDLSLKLVYDLSGKLLGAQGFGKSGVEKRIDVVAAALAGSLSLDDLAELDLAYAPPYSSANDPLNMAAFAAQNDLSGWSPSISASGAAAAIASQNPPFVLDVRTRGEYGKGHWKNSINIPVDELRDSLDSIPAGTAVLVISRAGFEGHLAERILKQAGLHDAKYVSGGITSLRLTAGWSETMED